VQPVQRKWTETAGGLTDSSKAICPPFLEGGHNIKTLLKLAFKSNLGKIPVWSTFSILFSMFEITWHYLLWVIYSTKTDGRKHKTDIRQKKALEPSAQMSQKWSDNTVKKFFIDVAAWINNTEHQYICCSVYNTVVVKFIFSTKPLWVFLHNLPWIYLSKAGGQHGLSTTVVDVHYPYRSSESIKNGKTVWWLISLIILVDNLCYIHHLYVFRNCLLAQLHSLIINVLYN
jgi:hypothetical protein